MRTFLDVFGFELRYQARSPLFAGVLVLFFVIHVLTVSQVGIHVGENDLVHLNSPYQILQTELVLGLFGLLPALIFIVNAATRDHERGTAELLFATPVRPKPWLLGRFAGGLTCALLAGSVGMLGNVVGTMVPWIDAARLGPLRATTFAAAFTTLTVPNLLVFSALAFSLAALRRSQTLALGLALVMAALEVVLHNATASGAPGWLTLIDPMGGLAIREAGRFWTVAELNTQVPVSWELVVNRVVWLGAAALTAVVALARVRLELVHDAPRRWLPRRMRTHAAPAPVPPTTVVRPPVVSGARAFLAQLRMEVRGVLRTTLFSLVALLVVVSTASEFSANTAPMLDLPLHPITSLMLGFFRYGLFQFVLMVLVFFSATLVFRERDHQVAEIVGASPTPDWVLPLAKTVTLIAAVSVLLLLSMATCIALQLAGGHTTLDLDVYLQGLFVYNGVYFFMLAVLAVLVQVVSPGRWSGMLLLFVVFAAVLSLEPLGYEHLLYGFRIPPVVHSDMNGFGHFRAQTYWLIAYWAAWCVVLLSIGLLLFPRGTAAGARERLRQARPRLTRPLLAVNAVAIVVAAATGAVIYWNTNVLNAYETQASRLRARADYERRFGTWKNRPTPAITDLSVEVDLHPSSRRLESRGRATLRNARDTPIAEFAISTDPRLVVRSLSVSGARIDVEDQALGFRVARLTPPLAPGGTLTLEWDTARENRGFPNSAPDSQIVANGTFIDVAGMMPLPAYDDERDLTDAGERRRAGLPPAPRLPRLGDPAWLNTLGMGVAGRATLRVDVSTEAGQTALAPGMLEKRYERGGRPHFVYAVERPVWPILFVASARYSVLRGAWRDVALEVYHDPKHPWNAPVMLDTAREAMAYFSRAFGPYPLRSFRILEYPRYRSAAQAFPGAVPYSESAGFLFDLRDWAPLDYTTSHELAHHWWGGLVYGARMQGRQVLNETMAQYSTFMLFKQQERQEWLRRILAWTHDSYLMSRSRENVGEQPVAYTEDQGNISYNKGALAMFALQDLIGEERMHEGLRNFLARFALKPPPYPTSLDLLHELRAVAGPDHQAFITDLFERIVLFDTGISSAEVRRDASGYEVTIDLTARKFVADAQGAEHREPIDGWFDVVVFPGGADTVVSQTPLYHRKHRLQHDAARLVVHVATRPGSVGVDPFHLMIDRQPQNNIVNLPAVE